MEFVIALAVVAAIAFFVSKNVDHGEARFDSSTGKVIDEQDNEPKDPATPAQRQSDR